MSTTVSSGSTATFGMDAFASLAVVPSASDTRGTITFTSAAPNSRVPSFSAKLQAKTFGPFLAPMSVSIVVEDGSCTYQLTGNAGGYYYDTDNDVTGLVGPDGGILPSTLTLISTGVAASVTGTTTKTALRTIAIPNGAMGPNSRLVVTPVWVYTNSANNKTLSVSIGTSYGGATDIYSRTRTTTTSELPLIQVANRGDVNAQILPYAGAGSYGVASTSSPSTATINFGVNDLSLYVSGQLASSGETITLESLVVQIINPYL